MAPNLYAKESTEEPAPTSESRLPKAAGDYSTSATAFRKKKGTITIEESDLDVAPSEKRRDFHRYPRLYLGFFPMVGKRFGLAMRGTQEKPKRLLQPSGLRTFLVTARHTAWPDHSQ